MNEPIMDEIHLPTRNRSGVTDATVGRANRIENWGLAEMLLHVDTCRGGVCAESARAAAGRGLVPRAFDVCHVFSVSYAPLAPPSPRPSLIDTGVAVQCCCGVVMAAPAKLKSGVYDDVLSSPCQECVRCAVSNRRESRRCIACVRNEARYRRWLCIRGCTAFYH